MNFSDATWLNRPDVCEVADDFVAITTEPHTDLWQRSYYGFRSDNAPALLIESAENFSFTATASFDYKARFDQCGLIVHLDSENWFKASIECEDACVSRLGSVVTNRGYSDWATTDIPTTKAMSYRLSRRGPDFLIEHAPDGVDFKQMRIFHLHTLGGTNAEMGRLDPPAPAERPIRFGVYACSPSNSSFKATFNNFAFDACRWMAHRSE